MNDRIIIPLSKKKLVLALIGSIIFVSLGYLMVVNPEYYTSPICRSPTFIRIAGLCSLIFFSLCLVGIARKLFDNRPGLIIDQYGITNNTTSPNMGLIEWKDITGIKKLQIKHTKFLILQTNKPKKYISRIENAITRRSIDMTYKLYGSPISIISASLKIDFEHLESLIRSEMEKRKESN